MLLPGWLSRNCLSSPPLCSLMPRKPTQRNWPRSSRTYRLAHQHPFSRQRRLLPGSDRQRLRVHLNIQPVVPLSIGKDWNLIGRTILPIISQHDVFYDPLLPVTQNRNQDSLSDTLQSFLFLAESARARWIDLGRWTCFALPHRHTSLARHRSVARIAPLYG